MIDSEFLAAFEDCTLPFERWNHLAHVRVAYFYASRLTLNEATDKMRSGVKAYNAANKVPDAIDRGYHETTTLVFMQLIHRAIDELDSSVRFEDFCNHHPELLDRRVLLCYYTRDRIMDADAKSRFVKPDLAPLDRIGLAYPEFGGRQEGVKYTMRPGSYGVITDNADHIGVVVTPIGRYLPGGGQENGESAVHALHRETLEECGLTIRVGAPIGMADEFVYAEKEDQHFCKRCSFYSAETVATGQSSETDHSLIWLTEQVASQQLSLASQRWAVLQACKSSTRARHSAGLREQRP